MTPIWTTRNFSASNVWESIACSRVGQKRVCLTMKFCVEVLSALTRFTHFCKSDESELLTRKNDRAIAPGAASYISRGIPLLAEAGIRLVWWTDRPDRDDACRVGREKALDRQFAISTRAEFLHVASRPG